MKKLTLALTTIIVAIALMGLTAGSANAAAFGWYASYGPTYQSYYTPTPIYKTGYGNIGYGQSYFQGDDHHDDVWHDTSHLHYRPSRLIRHKNHFHYVPGRYDVHQTGHFDHAHW